MDDYGRDDSGDYARDVHVFEREWFDEREADGNDDLYADGYQHGGIGYIHDKGYGDGVERAIIAGYQFVPERNAGDGVCRVHAGGQRRNSALYIFSEHQCEFPAIA